MPKRSNKFQRFVHDLEALLAPDGATVEESGMVLDRSTQEQVEVDVVIKIPASPRTLVVGVECRDRKRAADISWIDQLASRKQNLELDRLVAVSRSGFTQNARKKAEQLGIDIEEMNASKVIVGTFSFFAFLQQIRVEEKIRPYFVGMRVRFMDESEFQILSIEDTRVAVIYGPDGTEIGSLATMGATLAQAPVIIGLAERELPSEGEFEFEASCHVRPGSKLEFQGGLRSLAELEIKYRAERRLHSVPFNHFDYQNASGVRAEFDLSKLGKLKILMAQSEGGEPKISIQVEKPEPESD